MTRILVDADMLLFRACSAAEVEVELSDDVWVRHSEQPVARQMYWDQIYEWCDQFKAAPEHVMHCFTERSAFRRELSPIYKANRKGSKPTGFKAMKSEILRDEGAFMFHKIEADDLISIFAGMLGVYDDGVVIASGDKDLKQVPGTHVWTNTEPYEVSPDEATRFTYQQCLSGDSTDGIPGCKGIGPVNAERIVSKFDLSRPVDCWQEIVRTFEQKGQVDNPLDTAILQARLTRLLRAGDYNFNDHTVRLWNPPTSTSASLDSTSTVKC